MPLTPNVPPSPTGKPLTDLQRAVAINQKNTPGNDFYVFVISPVGHYFLTSDLVVPSGKSGISIWTNGGILDLNGFTIRGEDGSGIGIHVHLSNRGTLIIRNGRLRGLNRGVYLSGMGAILHATNVARLEKLIVTGCTLEGILGPNVNVIARHCIADNNGSSGIAANNAHIEYCRACNNGEDGFRAYNNAVVQGCVAHNNGRDGFHLVHSHLQSASVSDCAANGNVRNGFYIGPASRAERCLASGNGQAGFLGADSTSFRHNLSRGHVPGPGFSCWNGCSFEGNHSVSNNTGYTHTGTRNIYMRNSASGNAEDWDFASDPISQIVDAAKASNSETAPHGRSLGSPNARTNYSV